MKKVKRNTIIVSVITSFITTFMGSALTLSIPAVGEEFQAGASAVGWVITVYMIACTVLAVPFGRMADVVDRKFVLVTGVGIFTAASILGGLSQNLGILLVFRFLQGVGTSMIYGTNIAMLTAVSEDGTRGKALGYSTSAMYVGLSAGPVLGGILNHQLGWRSVFFAAAAVSAAAFFCALGKLPKAAEISGFKSPGFSLKYRLKQYLRRKTYLCANVAAMMNYGSNYAISYFLSIYLQTVMGYSSQTAGILLIASPLVQAVLSPFMGKLSDRLSPQKLSAAGMGVTAAVLGYFAVMPMDAGILQLILPLAAAGAGCAMFAAPNTNAVMAAVKKEDYGLASSILSTMRSLGHTLSIGTSTVITGFYLGKGSLKDAAPEALLETMHTSFAVFSVLCILGIFVALKRKV